MFIKAVSDATPWLGKSQTNTEPVKQRYKQRKSINISLKDFEAERQKERKTETTKRKKLEEGHLQSRNCQMPFM